MRSTEPRRKVYEVQTQLYDTYGKAYIDVEAFKAKIESLAKSDDPSKKPIIRLYAGVIHDRDTYTEEEVKHSDKVLNVGDPKPEHLHCAINLTNAMTASALCKLLEIDPRQLVYVRRRDDDDDQDNDTFRDKAIYLCHRRHPEKAQYEFSDIWCNFNYDEEFKRYEKSSVRKNKSKYSQAFIKEHLNKIYDGTESVRDIIREYGYDAYAYAKAKFDAAERDFEKRNYRPVPMRLTFLITGPSTVGKTPLAKLYACALFKDLQPNEAFYLASDPDNTSVTFQNYDGQPVIIYDDWRAGSFMHAFGRERLFNSLFAVYPEPSAFNIKYGSVVLRHNINIITTIEDPDVFIKGIAGEYRDRFGDYHQSEANQVLQAYKRVWSITRISEEEILIQINAGYLTGASLDYYKQYLSLCQIKNNVMELVKKYSPALYGEIGNAKYPDLIEETHKQIDKSAGKITDSSQIDPADLSQGERYDIDKQMSLFEDYDVAERQAISEDGKPSEANSEDMPFEI